MSIYKNLQPHVHVLKLTGGTGDGKTEIATVFASKEARTVLLRGVGRTNSTLKERLLVYSEEYTDKLLVAVKLNMEPYDKLSLSDLFVSSVAKVVRSQGKVVDSIIGRDEEELGCCEDEKASDEERFYQCLNCLYIKDCNLDSKSIRYRQ